MKHSLLSTIIAIITIIITTSCSRDGDETESTKKTSSTSPQQIDQYEAVDLAYGMLEGLTGSVEIPGRGEGRILSGTFKKLVFNNKEIPLKKNEVEGGMIQTKDYGKIKVTLASTGGMVVGKNNCSNFNFAVRIYVDRSRKNEFLKFCKHPNGE